MANWHLQVDWSICRTVYRYTVLDMQQQHTLSSEAEKTQAFGIALVPEVVRCEHNVSTGL